MPRPCKRTYHPSVSNPHRQPSSKSARVARLKDVDIKFHPNDQYLQGAWPNRRRRNWTAARQCRVRHQAGSKRRAHRPERGGYVTKRQVRGEFKVENLSPGKYSIPVSGNLRNSDLRFEESPFEIVDQDINGLVIKATRGGSISGVIVFEGYGCQSAENS